jgi:serine/threonine-protein kinase
MDLVSGEERVLFDTPTIEVKYAAGYLLHVRTDGTLVAAAFDADAGSITGPHVEIARDVSVSGVGFAQYSVSANGTVAYVPGFNNELVRVSRSGERRVLLPDQRRYHSPRLSPDARRIAYDDVTAEGRDVWINTVGTSEVTRATFHNDGHDPVWTRDGRGIYYLAGNGEQLDVFRIQLGSTNAAAPMGIKGELAYTGSPLPGGELLTEGTGPSRRLDLLSARAGEVPDTVLGTPADESYVVPSADGRWFAYVSDRSGRSEVYVRALRGGDALLQVSADGGTEPVWSRDGRELFYRRGTPTGAELVAARLELGAEPRVLVRSALFDVSDFDAAAPHANYDVSPDGWFVFARRVGSDHIVVLQNFPELVRRINQTGATP